MEDLEALVKAASSVDISLIDGHYHVEVIEHSGKLHSFNGLDLPWLIHNVHDTLLD
jgi:hypothetical protein